MGMSTTTYLVFGINFKDVNPLEHILGDDEDADDFNSFVLDELQFPDWVDSDKIENYREKREELFGNYPVELLLLGFMDYDEYALIIPKSKHDEYDPIDPMKMMEVTAPEKIAAFKEWCEKFNVEYTEPKWFLCSYTG